MAGRCSFWSITPAGMAWQQRRAHMRFSLAWANISASGCFVSWQFVDFKDFPWLWLSQWPQHSVHTSERPRSDFYRVCLPGASPVLVCRGFPVLALLGWPRMGHLNSGNGKREVLLSTRAFPGWWLSVGWSQVSAPSEAQWWWLFHWGPVWFCRDFKQIF